MILGMVELLTIRSVRGWARDGDHPTAPVRVRARDGENVLVEMDLDTHPSLLPKPVHSRAHAFCIEFQTPLKYSQFTALSIEAAPRGSDNWSPLPPPLKTWGPFLKIDPPLLQDADRESQLAREAAALEPVKFSFWSDEPGAPSQSGESQPVFVLGAARSGTTALGLALEKGTKYQGFPEGHVLDVAIRLMLAVNAHFEKKETWIAPREKCAYHLGHRDHAEVQGEIIAVLRRLAGGFTTPFWFDKTPTYAMIASVPIIAQAWPNSRFIFMKRRGLENIRSRIRKFSAANFRGDCTDWALIMSGWRTVRDMVPDRFIEIEQRTMLNDAAATAARVGRLLDLESAEVEAFGSSLGRERPEMTDPSANTVSDLKELGWSDEQIEIFRTVCGAEMDAYGYTYDAQYCS